MRVMGAIVLNVKKLIILLKECIQMQMGKQG